MKDVILKYALKNAYDYGRANAGAVAGKVIAEAPEAKKDMKKTMAEITSVIADVNKMKKADIEKALAKYTFAEKKEEEKGITLEGAERGRVVTRFLPEPNGFLHLGHAKAALLSYEAAKEYSGKCLLRFDDTNPEKEETEYVKAIQDDLKWLGLTFSDVRFTSDRMTELYEKAEQLIAQGDAYVCECPQEKIKADREAKRGCKCRERKDSAVVWKNMPKMKEGSAILRLKGCVDAENTVMRDPTLFRIMDAKHYRQGTKYRVWPTYDFEVSISDSLDGVTHAFRSKEYELRDELYYYIVDKLKMRKPLIYDFSRLNIRGNVLSKRLIKPLIEEKKVTGWDDPRLLTLRGLKRRGVMPAAIRSFVLSFGLSKVESNPSIEALLSENRKILEPTSEHYFFIGEPVKLKVKGLVKEVSLRKHPAQDLGERHVAVKEEVWIDGKDAAALKKGETFRLKDLCNAKIVAVGKTIDAELAADEMVPKKIQWVSAIEVKPAELMVIGDLLVGDDYNKAGLTIRKGFCEKACETLKEGDVVQFERIGYARKDGAKRYVLSC
ncbi:Glutamate--tRNA ligase [Candidatus Norongarragalina meridionalis]|nr:Glutamate--tRNA ligase [Candidatus Norongarragalina meridionalis]